MSFATVRQDLVAELAGQDGAFGWWLITRFHPVANKIQAISEYLYEAGAGHGYVRLTSAHYAQIGRIVGAPPVNPGIALRRHDLLAMDTPLRLLERFDGHHWDQIRLTARGVAIATNPDIQGVFESALQEIRFAKVPWFTPQRVAEYAGFDVLPYSAIQQVLAGNGGHLDMDEYDLFVSRVKTAADIPSTTQKVAEFRSFTVAQKSELRDLVRTRFFAVHGAGAGKRYSNWRDTARHTFSLLSLGQSMYREGNDLYLTTAASEVTIAAPAAPMPAVPPAPPIAAVPPAKKKMIIVLPADPAPGGLTVPPAIPQANTGAEAELLVGKLLTAAGWNVVYYNQKRGYGFDLWAKKGTAAFVIEVKSSVGQYGGLMLTPMEFQAAGHYGDSFLLVIVENLASIPDFRVIRNPRQSLVFATTNTEAYTAPRATWFPAVAAFVP